MTNLLSLLRQSNIVAHLQQGHLDARFQNVKRDFPAALPEYSLPALAASQGEGGAAVLPAPLRRAGHHVQDALHVSRRQKAVQDLLAREDDDLGDRDAVAVHPRLHPPLYDALHHILEQVGAAAVGQRAFDLGSVVLKIDHGPSSSTTRTHLPFLLTMG